VPVVRTAIALIAGALWLRVSNAHAFRELADTARKLNAEQARRANEHAYAQIRGRYSGGEMLHNEDRADLSEWGHGS
jgi:hypothetical protein